MTEQRVNHRGCTSILESRSDKMYDMCKEFLEGKELIISRTASWVVSKGVSATGDQRSQNVTRGFEEQGRASLEHQHILRSKISIEI